MTDPPETLQKEFSKARNSRVTNLNKYEKQRKKRHKQGTLFFRNSNFTFVVEDCKIVTVEISIKSKRDLNKKKGLI